MRTLIAIIALIFLAAPALAQVNVNGYYRSNGTYVQPYTRTAPDYTRTNNYNYPGNYNPNTGRVTGGSYFNNTMPAQQPTGNYYARPSAFTYRMR